MSVLKCPLCGNEDSESFVWVRDGQDQTVEVVCGRCGCVVLDGLELQSFLERWGVK